jgi:hypothetical protein
MTQPSVGRIVHYVSRGMPPRTDKSQAYAMQCRAAVITGVPTDPPAGGQLDVGLAVLSPEGMSFKLGVSFNDGAGQPGSPDCPLPHENGPMRYCQCGWTEPTMIGGTWHWPERMDG